jgi:hypothetical protein
MNELAMITSVKNADGEEVKGNFNEELTEIQTWDAYYQIMQALSAARSSLVWADLTRDEKISAHAEILRQFVDADTDFFPTYIDAVAKYYGMETYSAKESEVKDRFLKAGATISAATAEKIRAACDQIRSGHDSLLALLEGKAGPSTLSTKAAESTPEPAAEDHSESEAKIRRILEELSN